MVEEFLKNGYRLAAYIGLHNSPTCGIHWGKHKVNRYSTESPMPVDNPDPKEPVLMGIMAEILSEKFHALNMDVPFLELPIQQPPESEQRTKFWLDLKHLVEPRNPEYMEQNGNWKIEVEGEEKRQLLEATIQAQTSFNSHVLHARGITKHHFTLFVNHLIDTLWDRGINDQDVTDIISRISTYAEEITGDISSAG